MLNLVLMVLSTAGMLGVGWFVWKKLQAQDASAADSSSDRHSDDNTDTTPPS
ncbi:MAG: hypothetical protein IH984_06040 [Planctomycetes bacterium]|nr:hypothetical protein [Planctomycetota bacterium]